MAQSSRDVILRLGLLVLAAGVTLIASGRTAEEAIDPAIPPIPVAPLTNASGEFHTIHTAGTIDTSNPFFQDLGTNGRRCVTCHQPDSGWTITPANVQRRFAATDGMDPIFRTNDGSNCDTADVSTREARTRAYSLLLEKGLIRVELPVPDDAEFDVTAIDNPYGCSNAAKVSVYRRVLPSTNVSFLSTVMWDGRETFPGNSLEENLMHQAMDATMGHAQGASAPSEDQQHQIAQFQMALYTAQTRDKDAGALQADGARGGTANLTGQEFFLGINDPLGLNPTGAAFRPEVFDLYTEWEKAPSFPSHDLFVARRSVAHGERLFNNRPIAIKGVAGLNDKLGQPVIMGFCGTCHDSPNVGNHSVPAPLNIGLADAIRRTPDLPLLTLENKTTHEVFETSDPGRALITGKWADVGKFKGPILRGLAARAPYFHNGSAATLPDVVNFYDTRFELHLTQQEKEDLVAFLRTL